MTLRDWATATRRRYQGKPPGAATVESVREFVRGVRKRLWYARGVGIGRGTVPGGWGDTAFYVESPTDVARAKTLNREHIVADWLLDAVDADTVFWDVGAYHGHYSVLAADAGAHVVAFEPRAENRDRIRRHEELNDVSIELRSVALSDQEAAGALEGDVASEGSVTPDADGGIALVPGDSVEPQPDVMKIDVEGHEQAVLDGLETSLPAVERIAIEVHDCAAVSAVERRLDDAGLEYGELETPRSQTYIAGWQA